MKGSWEELKTSISHASPGFYSLIREMNYEDLLVASDGIRYTVWKYFNRAKYRATPFGSFAGIGLLEIGTSSQNTVIMESEQHLHHFRDWPETVSTAPLTNDFKYLKFFTNHSYYLLQNTIRYVSRFNDQHELSEVESDPVILKILKLCTTPAAYDEILATSMDSICEDSVASLIGDLLAAQLLFSSDQPAVISSDHSQKLNMPSSTPGRSYVLSERKVAAGRLPPAKCRHLPELADLLNGLLQPEPARELTKFIAQFRQKFGAQWIPIMHALDPEIGLGYGNLDQINEDTEFHPFLKSQSASTKVSTLKQQLQHYLDHSELQRPAVIRLEHLSLKPDEECPVLPNSLTVLASVSGDRLHLESIGGCTTNAVSGRFSLCGEPYKEYCREIKQLEQDANPEVLFFDIAYISEKGTENINRRASIYDLQLNLLNYGPSTDQLNLGDLLLALQGDELVLYSVKLQKRLIPRMASAYNYSRSDLAVFRLLCDLQHQGLQTDLNLNLSDLYPDLSYYPRLMFKNIIISPAAWKVDLKAMECSTVIDTSSVREHLKKLGVPGLFQTGETDQTLCFNQQDDQDMWAFANYLSKHKVFYVKEAWKNGFTRDPSGRPYHNQLVISLIHGHQIYEGFEPNSPIEKSPKTKACFAPGSKWFYFQIYCHPFRADQLLLDIIKPFLAEYRANIEKWFFIRYDENGSHIRLRICLNDPGLGMRLTTHLSGLLDPYLQSGIVSEFLISTYKPEIQRYGADLIEQVEAHFFRDSELNLALLSTPLTTFAKYKHCEHIFNILRRSGIFESQELNHLIQSVSDSFVSEFHAIPSDFKHLNENYRNYLKIIPPLMSQNQQQALDLYCASLSELLNSCKGERKRKLFSDLIHMHVNRLFSTAQRKHEFCIYYFASKISKNTQFKVPGERDTITLNKKAGMI